MERTVARVHRPPAQHKLGIEGIAPPRMQLTQPLARPCSIGSPLLMITESTASGRTPPLLRAEDEATALSSVADRVQKHRIGSSWQTPQTRPSPPLQPYLSCDAAYMCASCIDQLVLSTYIRRSDHCTNEKAINEHSTNWSLLGNGINDNTVHYVQSAYNREWTGCSVWWRRVQLVHVKQRRVFPCCNWPSVKQVSTAPPPASSGTPQFHLIQVVNLTIVAGSGRTR